MSKEACSFVIYLIHACAREWGLFPSEVYRKLQGSGCIDHYLVPHYEVLHTLGTGYLVEDIQEYLKLRGVRV